jgi:hypothetical protein
MKSKVQKNQQQQQQNTETKNALKASCLPKKMSAIVIANRLSVKELASAPTSARASLRASISVSVK